MREFKYDVIALIHAVQERPCLWDKTSEIYKDRLERRAAWEQVFTLLEEKYEEMSSQEKRFTGEHILNKWTNIRDTFVKSLKSKAGRPRRKYLLYDHLKFLIKVTATEEDCTEYNNDESYIYMKPEKLSPQEPSKKRSKKSEYDEPKQKEYDKNDMDFVEVDECNDPRIMNEDEAFFASLLPSVVKYNEDERLEFRMEVLAIMKRIKDKRKWTNDV
ncbi:unnamed protein product [Danaus chrysippus]|uniref:(African queen) hypothetical protein n=1 Tax=Danaus chrysippus TaxID=151541 RepID=A0A8J2VTQ3_9NEOP|nr:unnamed protein product [Danaus chrysippus]